MKKFSFSLTFLFLLSIASTVFSAETCVEASRTCTSGPATKIVSGISVYKDCWNYSINYKCYTEGNYIDNCSGIKQIPSCSQLSSICQSNLSSGGCESYKNQYLCNTEITNAEVLNLTLENKDQHITTEVLDDSSCSSFDRNSNCKLSQDSVCVGTPETRVINGMSITRDCWSYQKKYYCTGDYVNECTKYEDDCQLKNHSCLMTNDVGSCTYTTNTYQCLTPAVQSSLACGSQTYITYNKDQNFAKSAANLGVLQEAASQLDKNSQTTFAGIQGKCGKDTVNFSNCCSMSGWNSDASNASSYGNNLTTPTSMVIDSLASCSASEKNLRTFRANKLCVYVGSYCDKKEPLTKACLSKKESYCCFNNLLSKIVQEQGRPQIGMGWGSAESPNCGGIPINDFSRIDFSKFDWSELGDDLKKSASAKIQDSQSISDKVSSTVKNYYSK